MKHQATLAGAVVALLGSAAAVSAAVPTGTTPPNAPWQGEPDVAIPKSGGPVSFVSIGDWGGVALQDYHKTDELAVAKTFAASAEKLDAQFVVNVGDNFYYYGVWNTSDPQWDEDFEQVFTEPSMMVKWYSVLGNHDYGFNPDAQTQYKSPNKDRWVMDAKYYTKRVQIGADQYISFVFIDSAPCNSAYRADDPSGWDPCGSAYPAPADCQFHKNVLAQDCNAQLTWLKSAVAAIPDGDWKIAVTHMVGDEIDVVDMISVLQEAKFDLYLNGHSHELTYYQIDNAGAYVTTGAGCMVKLDGTEGGQVDTHQAVKKTDAHSINFVWNQKVAGFTTHTFSSDLTKLTTNFVDYTGATLYSFDITKGKPTPPHPSDGSCAVYGCVYDRSHTCQCNSDCSKYNDCCSDYQKVCG